MGESSQRPAPRSSDAETGPEPALDAELTRALRAAPAGRPELEDLFGALERQVRRERGPAAWLRSRSTPARLVFAGGVSAVIVLAAYAWFARPDLAVYPLGRMLTVLLIGGGALAASLGLALRPTHRPAAPSWVAPVITGVGLLGLGLVYLQPALPALDPAHAHGSAPGLGAALHLAAPCLGIGLVIALALYALWSLLDRGGVRRGLPAAAAAALTANLALQLHCPITDPVHLLLGHLGVALVILGVVLAARR